MTFQEGAWRHEYPATSGHVGSAALPVLEEPSRLPTTHLLPVPTQGERETDGGQKERERRRERKSVWEGRESEGGERNIDRETERRETLTGTERG